MSYPFTKSFLSMMQALQQENASLRHQLKEALKKCSLLEAQLQDKQNEECAICLTPLQKSGKSVFQTTCGHAFHFKCVKKVVMTSQSTSGFCCPLCRKSFTSMTPPRTPLRTSTFPGFVSARAMLTPTSIPRRRRGTTTPSSLSTQMEQLEIQEEERISDGNNSSNDDVDDNSPLHEPESPLSPEYGFQSPSVTSYTTHLDIGEEEEGQRTLQF